MPKKATSQGKSAAKKAVKKSSPKKASKGSAKAPPKAAPKKKTAKKSVKKLTKQQKKKEALKKMTRRQRAVHRRKATITRKIRRRRQLLEARLKAASKFQIRCRKPVEDEIFDVDEFKKYLLERFKVDGKTGDMGSGRSGNIIKSGTTIHVTCKKPFPKYYLKFLTKRYLKRHGLRDYVRVIADKKSSYELRYFNIHDDADRDKNKGGN